MDELYSFYDYEYSYTHSQWGKCKKIGIYLLSLINNDRARELKEKLSKVDIEIDNEENAKLLSDVKIWIMIHKN